MLGTRNRGGSMEGADGSTELWRHPKVFELLNFSGKADDILQKCFNYLMIGSIGQRGGRLFFATL